MAENKNKDIRMAIKFRGNSATDLGPRIQKAENEVSTPKAKAFSLDSYKWSEYNYTNTSAGGKLLSNKLVLTEFQPDRTYNFGEILKNNAVIDKVAGFFGGAIGSTVGQTAGKLTQQYLIDTYSKNPEGLTDPNSTSMDLIRNMMKGQYLNTFEIPYHETNYFNADTTDGWSAAGSESMMGSQLSQIMQSNGAINFPMPAQWNNNGSGIGMQIAPAEFYLINSSSYDLIRNFKFLHSFVAGAFWVQADYMQMSPNLYDIECPGRFHRHWVAMGINVTQEGKLRMNSDISNSELSNWSGINKQNILFPEAYKITCSFKDLTPNSYNCWASYLLNGKDGQITMGNTTTGGILEDTANNVSEAVVSYIPGSKYIKGK